MFKIGLISLCVAGVAPTDLATDAMWLRLGHYQPTHHAFRSEADGLDFFFSPIGKTDPRAELDATLRAFAGPVDDPDEHAICRFPARASWLREQLGESRVPRLHCAALEEWVDELEPARITLVFADAYLNAPASMFGHTLLRVDRSDALDNPLLSTVINYAATPDTGNLLLYPLRGLTGGFPGRFSVAPYYEKVQEYSDLEARDVWEYRLSLTPKEIRRLLEHTWELSQTWFEYYFIPENCSYHLLGLLEVARPALDLSSHFPLMTFPAATVRAVVAVPGLVSARVYRPSQTREMNARRGALSGRDVDLAAELVLGELAAGVTELEKREPPQRARILEAALDYLERRGGYQHGHGFEERELDLLRLRGALAVDAEAPDLGLVYGPDEGHGAQRIDLGVGVDGHGRFFQELSYRPALHDLLDPSPGYVPTAQIEVASVRLRMEPTRWAKDKRRQDALTLDRLDLLRITSIAPKWGWDSAMSWRAAVSVGRVRDLECTRWDCAALTLEGGAGYALGTRWLGREVWYGFIEGEFVAGGGFVDGFRAGVGARLGILLQPAAWLSLMAEGTYRFDFVGDTRAGEHVLGINVGVQAHLHRIFAMRLRGFNARDTRELTLSGVFYFD